jgi:V-type H+-transporting ATPase subunit a
MERILDPNEKEHVPKDVFVAFYQGAALEEKVKLICNGFQATVYPCPAEVGDRLNLEMEIQSRLSDLRQVLTGTDEHLHKLLRFVCNKLPVWKAKVIKIKSVYNLLNQFDFDNGRKSLLASCWCPADSVNAIQQALTDGAARSNTDGHPIFTPCETKKSPPTYHRTDKFTSAFQAIVDAYGVATYQEVNPAPFTIITFPFLFAVMFGDLGHGLLMALFAYYMVRKEESLMKWRGGGEIWDTMFGGRYIILLMGLFSIYTGLIYNDCFSKSMTIWGPSGWQLPKQHTLMASSFQVSTSRECGEGTDADTDGCFTGAYPIGLDPIWSLSSNKLTFTNSFKMKMSVILGVMQMAFGVALSYHNGKFFKKDVDVYHVFLPQIIFMLSIFGYLCLMIIYKWMCKEFPNGNPPSLLLMLINMFLKLGSPPEPAEVLYGDKEGAFQNSVETLLVTAALICVPWMLLVKPLKIREELKREAERTEHLERDGGEAAIGGHDEEEDDDGESHDFAEIMVHQSIHTIEFCLGCISNTASYLRLWALSLAHAQLSEVLWEMILVPAWELQSPIILWAAFAVWAVLTICVLLIMEGLSAFLHALRLHWVEFQNKFYVGTGYLFEPFDFSQIIDGHASQQAVSS